MKHLFYFILAGFIIFISLCYAKIPNNDTQYIHFAVAAEYPPFEYNDHGELKGFDIDLARLIAKKLNKEALFDTMQFSSILPAISTGQVDAAISTLTITEQRKKNFDFTKPYYFESMAVVFPDKTKISNIQQLAGKKIGVQLGSTMEIWLKQNVPSAHLLVMDNNNQTIAALKAGHIDMVLMDGVQGAVFSQKNSGLSFSIIAKSADGYGLALKKNAKLTQKINQILNELEQNGELTALKKQWLEGTQWKS
ncbi:ABC transporter substrate-binding protein [Fluoribacter dumoffii]|uniref:Arginine-binding extracellular protein ArtP n=1 Tax=Fluoribacter dumoffii TaxID=463 RepID=A0A377G9P5_9GAMM|nr:ABC transporter substrate-binding protein [Fluoribacter dumoffii]KTC90103.1 amino acid ABC transporter substrate-binding protein [Fluoribacter dumoffii NY 23]MCW8385400.1 ABC transporter substrate-binding protein [Fluoribacter dumoffii]MCW8418453.1 ABC transporter substrate-binding protein [Fluoribacter dumoffii]MCW8453705.1 ABC transporter substrate-binding protein [Fluoribacter dumoffii]MCW8462224.1 ABC transporter substrate-binding protein [Fluoribacter dumoffii]